MDRIALPIPLYFYLCFSHNHLWPGILLESHGFPLYAHQRQCKNLWSQDAMRKIRRRVPEMEAREPQAQISLLPHFCLGNCMACVSTSELSAAEILK